MASSEKLKSVRIEKLEKIKAAGIDPYPISVDRTHSIGTLDHWFKVFSMLSRLFKREFKIAGRIMSMRGQGAVIFVDLFDGTGRFQALLKKNLGRKFAFFKEVIDVGDFVQVSGRLFKTQKGQKTIEVTDWQIVSKSLRPIPTEFYGLKDEDERYRRRYLDILLNPETRKMIQQKSIFWNSIRDFMLRRGFVEVQTPVLENVTGGADARPFETYHNSLDIDVYLRISAGELWQKKLLVAGLPKIFEIGRIFRNEGMSNEHLQDYTQIEFYEAYSDYTKGMKMVKDLYRTVAQATFGTTKFIINDQWVDLSHEWQIFDFVKIIGERFGLDVLEASRDDVVEVMKKHGLEIEKNINKEKAVDALWKSVRGEFVGPGFLINAPIFLEPLAKKNPNNPQTVQRFQVILGGSEMGKGFSELNDPMDQAERFSHQDKLRKGGDDEAQMNDNEYVEAMEYGMPPAFGFGISERLFAVLAGKSVREATIFPLMRPKE